MRIAAVCLACIVLAASGVAVKYLIGRKAKPPVTPDSLGGESGNNSFKDPPKGTSDSGNGSTEPEVVDSSAPRTPVKPVIHPPVIHAPAIHSFIASQPQITSGQPTLLQWNVSGATVVSIEGIGQLVAGQTSRPVCPTAPKTYILTATGPGGTVHKSVDVSVTIPPGQNVKLDQFDADPKTIGRGQVSVLRWNVENASSVWIEPDIGQVEACGVLKVQPLTTTQYRLAYQNDRGTMRSKPVVITVE
jgi:hypothetical protein